MEEVSTQLKPFKEMLDRNTAVTEATSIRVKGLWGNGTGPPGYLETAREEDKRREEKRDRQTKEILEEIQELRDKMMFKDGSEAGQDKTELAETRRKKSFMEKWGLTVAIIGTSIGFFSLLLAVVVFLWDLKVKSGEVHVPKIGDMRIPDSALSWARPQNADNDVRYR